MNKGFRQAYTILYITYIVLPILAGFDKVQEIFTHTHIFAEWSMYLAPIFPELLNLESETFMKIVGVIEMAAGLIVAFKPKIGAYVVAFWLLGIAINILILGKFYDIALRDVSLMMGALALGRLSSINEKH